ALSNAGLALGIGAQRVILGADTRSQQEDNRQEKTHLPAYDARSGSGSATEDLCILGTNVHVIACSAVVIVQNATFQGLRSKCGHRIVAHRAPIRYDGE